MIIDVPKSFVIVLACALSPVFLAKVPVFGPSPDLVPLNALAAGAIAGAGAYILFKLVHETQSVNKAVLAGLLVAEVMVVNTAWGPSAHATMAGITLWLFFYFHTFGAGH